MKTYRICEAETGEEVGVYDGETSAAALREAEIDCASKGERTGLLEAREVMVLFIRNGRTS